MAGSIKDGPGITGVNPAQALRKMEARAEIYKAPAGRTGSRTGEGEAMDYEELRGPWADYDVEQFSPPKPDVIESYRAASREVIAPRQMLGVAYGGGERE